MSEPSIYNIERSGSTVRTMHTERKLLMYGIYESELHDLGHYDWATNICFAVASGAVSIGVSMLVDPGQGRGATSPGLLIAVGAVAGLVGYSFRRIRGSIVDRIKRECGTQPNGK